MNIQIKLLENGILPTRAYEYDAGWDLYCAIQNPVQLRPFQPVKIPVGISLAIPRGFEGQIRPRSSVSARGIYVGLGTIDSQYRGPVSAVCVYIGKKEYHDPDLTDPGEMILPGDRIAQLVIAEVPQTYWDVVENLDDTVRGQGGFGSSGR